MPYYHVYIHWEDEVEARWGENIDFSLEQIIKLVETIKEGTPFVLKNFRIIPFNITKLEIWKTEERAYGKSDTWRWIPSRGVNVTNSFIIALPTKPDSRKIEDKTKTNSSEKIKTAVSKNIFIVHGKNHKPMKELKAMLEELGFDPVILHEQPSGSRTIVEKLEKYSDVGYAFVILTPDDLGTSDEQFNKYNKNFVEELARFRQGKQTEDETKRRLAENVENFIENRARQNVVLEFGYFIGKLNRDKVCCLLKGDVERPSDMHGIVYIPFKESVNEVRDKIVKELKAAGYQIKI